MENKWKQHHDHWRGSHARPSLLISLDQIQTHDWVGEKPNHFNPSMYFGGNQELKTIYIETEINILGSMNVWWSYHNKNCSTYIPERNFGNSLEIHRFTHIIFPRGNVNLTICSGRGCHACGCMTSMKAPTGKGDKALFPPQSCESRLTEHFSQFSNRAFGSSGPKWPNGIFDNQIQTTFLKRCYHKGF